MYHKRNIDVDTTHTSGKYPRASKACRPESDLYYKCSEHSILMEILKNMMFETRIFFTPQAFISFLTKKKCCPDNIN
jgi:capsule polysaccharide export protein KpsC/LpsZ